MLGLKEVPVPGSGSMMCVVATLWCMVQGGACLSAQSVGDPCPHLLSVQISLFCFDFIPLPVVFCGDFNSLPFLPLPS